MLCRAPLTPAQVQNFPFPSPPAAAALASAERCLAALCALCPATGALTDVGRAMAHLPIGPRHARMLLEVAAWQARLPGAAAATAAAAGGRALPTAAAAAQALPFAVALAAVLTVGEPFVHVDSVGGAGEGAEGEGEEGGAEEARERKERQQAARRAHARLQCGGSDALGALRALCGFLAAAEDGQRYAARYYLHHRALQVRTCPRRALSTSSGGQAFLPSPKAGMGFAARVCHLPRHQLGSLTPLESHAMRWVGVYRTTTLVGVYRTTTRLSFAWHAGAPQEAADLHRQLLRILTTPSSLAPAAPAPAAGGGGGRGLAGVLAGLLAERPPEEMAAAVALGEAAALPTPVQVRAYGARVCVRAQVMAAAAGCGTQDSLTWPQGVERRHSPVPLVLLRLPRFCQDCLRRALAVGWADSVARRVRSAEFLARQQVRRGLFRAVKGTAVWARGPGHGMRTFCSAGRGAEDHVVAVLHGPLHAIACVL